MDRANKIRLLQDIAAGKRTIIDILPQHSVLIRCKSGYKSMSTGRVFKFDLSDLPTYCIDKTCVILPENGREHKFD
jgi:hypothetical protein